MPLVGVNHLEGHLFSAHLATGGQPRSADRVSRSTGSSSPEATRSSSASRTDRIVPIARTRDDAPGEAFDKVARRAGLGYPGGPVVDRDRRARRRKPLRASRWDGAADGSDDFSFSGLKTAMLREFEKRGVDGSPLDPETLPARPGRPLRVLPARDRDGAPRARRDRAPAGGNPRRSPSPAASRPTRSCARTLSAGETTHGVPRAPAREGL